MQSVPRRQQTQSNSRRSGFTLLELMVVVAIIGIVITLVVPSFRQFILLQRLKSVNAQVVTDMQFARSEAVSRGIPVHVKVQAGCYVILTTPTAVTSTSPTVVSQCDCTAAEGARCTAPAKELKTVQLGSAVSVYVNIIPYQAANFAFDPRTGGIQTAAFDYSGSGPTQFVIDSYISSTYKYRNIIGLTGRVQVCIPTGSTLSGTAC